ncbi:bifunctional [glutamate--ammonia ligase]-adenylyl-L-tyrosine phosphorylase/[glutamate--ammonia-ligase] adenylyltransferase [Luteimonas mephitis]|uniref:bifunctional [glutamate--ammonia ligase]-adenylyl-L-tyrosine phosphorylase/[glutamate--ammonia-ligase] adenylyltransferase n=1 Tax=Luteimonas mephitis TaxID=83615 RepID=UPI003A90F639
MNDPALPPAIPDDPAITRALARFAPEVLADPGLRAKLARVALASDFAIAVLARQPELLARLAAGDGADPLPPPRLEADSRADWPALLRRHRAAGSARLAWRDVLGLDDVDATLAGSTALAEQCLQVALAALEHDFAARHGVVRDRDGNPQRLVVFGLGKLGGGELNFSSDIDLVYAYANDGESDGPRPLAAEAYFARLGQQLAKLLDEVTADGFCHRVDLRLRPFGNAGRVALSFAAMEQYFQREGRDWERYAWQKARPVAGDIAAGESFLETLRPFVYRRYLDFGALDGLRAMKAALAAEVARKDLADDIKRGPGGIREIEFLAQALQLIHGGRDATLRSRSLMRALHALCEANHLSVETRDMLVAAYRHLRRLENRLQMLRDAQTHALPEDPSDRARVATALGHADWPALRTQLDGVRVQVADEFAALLAPRRRKPDAGGLAAYWQALPDGGDAAALADAGYADPAAADTALRDFVRTPGVRDLSDGARARLDRVVPVLVQAAGSAIDSQLVLRRLLALLHNILRRASYLALLDEQPAALSRLVNSVVRSAFLAERVATLPLLLDELLDARVAGPLPERDAFAPQCAQALAHDDTETALMVLNETRQALSFRIALATLDGRQHARDSARQLAWLADAVLGVVLQLALREMRRAHGDIAGARFGIVGYGSLGGEELGFGSDLDLVFLYDAPPVDGGGDLQSDGARALDAPRWFARLAQKIVSLLGTVTAAGRLYDIDVRLRPDGGKGLLVSTLSSYDDYQHHRAWTWEHQALVRARFVAGDAALGDAWRAIRDDTLGRPRGGAALREDVDAMRRRMRAELDRSDAAGFDLKQGEGGLVDLEFLLQYLVLRDAAQSPLLLVPRDTPGLVDACIAAGALDEDIAAALHEAHGVLLAAGLDCTLDRRRRWVVENDAVAAARAAVRAGVRSAGLVFDERRATPREETSEMRRLRDAR